MANYKEIIVIKEFYLFDGEPRMAYISVYITPDNKFLCIMKELAPNDNNRLCMLTIETFATYKEVRTWIKNVQWYDNGNEYDNSNPKDI